MLSNTSTDCLQTDKRPIEASAKYHVASILYRMTDRNEPVSLPMCRINYKDHCNVNESYLIQCGMCLQETNG
eukprot:6097646-Pleurochrysis_carterae.AAC.1